MSRSPIRSFANDFDRIVQRQPAAIAAVGSDGGTLTYAQFDQQSDRMLAFLEQHNVAAGDTVVALMPNAVSTILLFIACLKGGVRYAPLACTATATEVQSLSRLSHAKRIIIADAASERLAERLENDRESVLRVPSGNEFSWLPDNGSRKRERAGQLLIATSGSTGVPKAIVIEGDRLWSAGVAFSRLHELESCSPRFWNYLPMSYLGGLFNLALIPLCAGGNFVVDEPFSGKTFLGFWQTVERFQINALWMVPSVTRGLLALAERTRKPVPHPEIRVCFLGTAPISLAEKERFRQFFGIEMLENYALSETTFLTSEFHQTLIHRSEGSVGSVLPYVQVKLLDTTTESDEKNDPASQEIAVRSPYLMLGYLGQNGILETELDDDGFFRTGDLGRFSRGQLVITGRIKDIIKRGGYLIVLREIEQIAEMYPGIAEAAAIPCPHPFYGESYTLCLRWKTEHAASDATVDFTAWLHDKLVRHKWPERVLRFDEFPRTQSGKVKKFELGRQVAGV